MSDTDDYDRMERAERIRKMRQSREPGDENEDAEAEKDAPGANADADGTTDDDSAAETAADGADAGGGDVDAEHDDPGSVTDEAADADPNSGQGTEATDAATDVTTNAATDRQDLMTGTSPAEARRTEVAAQAAQSEASAIGAQPAATATPEHAANATNGAAGTAATAEAAASGPVAPLGGSTDFSLPDLGEMEGAGDATGEAEDEPTGGAARGHGGVATTTEPSVRVLEFTVGDQIYCIDIERVEEIVKREAITRVPNTEAYVEGVVDLRGQITTILDTKQLLDVEEEGPDSLLVIFAPDAFEEHGTVGWVVDEVRQVVPVMDSQVRTAPSDEDYVRGVVDREGEDELVVWIRPGDVMGSAVAVESDD